MGRNTKDSKYFDLIGNMALIKPWNERVITVYVHDIERVRSNGRVKCYIVDSSGEKFLADNLVGKIKVEKTC